MLPVLAAVATLVALAANRIRVQRRAERDCAQRLPLGPDGVVVGAGAIALDGPEGAPAVLLLHGGGDTPQTLRYLAEHLHARGFTVRVPLLPGHGRAVCSFGAVDADAWLAHARAELDALDARGGWTGLVGLSMGGALAVRLAAERPALPALCLLAPYLAMPTIVRRAARTVALWGPFVPYVRASDGRRQSILDPEERGRSLAYGWFTPSALRALAATVVRATAVLPQVAAPTLMLQSDADNRIAPAAARAAFARLGATEKTLEWVEGAHVLTVDHGRLRVFDAVAGWLEEHGARGAPRRQAG